MNLRLLYMHIEDVILADYYMQVTLVGEKCSKEVHRIASTRKVYVLLGAYDLSVVGLPCKCVARFVMCPPVGLSRRNSKY